VGSPPLPPSADVVIVGGGIVGLTIALELRHRRPTASIVVIEKEHAVGMHASGRNSGVLHAGFYYTADSLKAKLTRDGNRRLAAWCDEHGVPLRRCGKLVVARDASEHAGLDLLLERAALNGVPLEAVDEADARRIEPRIRTAGRALWSPTTAAVDPGAVMRAMAVQAQRRAITLAVNTRWLSHAPGLVRTLAGTVAAGYVVNAAGLHADRIAHAYGFGANLRILPFRGTYLYASPDAPELRTHVYPVPDLDMPFLGVHFTVTADGTSKIGPTAFPLPWREAYDLTSLSGASTRDVVETVASSLALFADDPSFRRHAATELPKLRRSHLVKHAAELIEGVGPDDYLRWGRPGIRAQLYDAAKRRLVMDFRFEGDDRSMHVLNAVSPAFTCSLAFAELVVNAIDAA
jgi:(S)-2-hydroxyglutarate dehydrogenase